jgi:hypothetical protein
MNVSAIVGNRGHEHVVRCAACRQASPTAIAAQIFLFYHVLLPTAGFLPETMYLHAHNTRDFLPGKTSDYHSHTDGSFPLIAGRILSSARHLHGT